MQNILKKLTKKEDLTAEEATEAMNSIMTGEAGETLTSAFLTSMVMKGETPLEIESFARVMRKAAVAWNGTARDTDNVCDTCGTGGDGHATINISTLSAIVLAAAGIKVAKHGNRAVSSATGSADLLETLGVSLSHQDATWSKTCLEKVGITFLFAQSWHPAMKYAGPVRKALGFRTVFNILGPLTNPAPITHQLVGVFDPRFLEPLAHVLLRLGRKTGYVLHSEDGLDEISPAAPTHYFAVQDGKVVKGIFQPEDFGIKRFDLSHIQTRGREDAIARARGIIAGKGSSEEKQAVCMNAAPLYSAIKGMNLKASFEACMEILGGASAQDLLQKWISASEDPVSSLGHQ